MIPTSFFACRYSLLSAVAVLAACGVFASAVHAQQPLYWDTNGSAAGASNTGGAPGTWSIFNPADQNWSTSAAGTTATQLWPNSGPYPIAAFSAGANATGAYEVIVRDTNYVSGLNFNLGDVTLSSFGRVHDTIFPVPPNNIFPVYTAAGTTATLRNLNITPSITSQNAVGNWTLNKTGSGTLAFDSMRATEFGLMQCNEGTTSVSNQGMLSTTRIEVGTSGTAALSLSNVSLSEQRMTPGAQSIVLGVNAGSSGTLNYGGGGTQRTSFLRGDMIVGKQGSGTLNLDANADLRAENGIGNAARLPGRFVLGLSPGSSGTMTLNPTSYCEVVGLNGVAIGSGSGVLNLNGGWLATRSDSYDVPFSSSVPIILTGTSRIGVAGSTSTLSGPVSGTGSFRLTGGGTLRLTSGTSFTGDTLIESASLTVTGSGASLGNATSATNKIVANANLTVSAGAVARPATSVQIGTGGGTGSATITGAGSRLTAGSFIEVGSSGTGTMDVSNSGQVISTTTTAVGLLAGSLGSVNVTGAGSSLSTGSTLFVGYYSTGVCTVGSGGSVTAGDVLLGLVPGSSGTFVLNPGGTLNVGGANGISAGTGAAGFAFAGGLLKVTGSSLSTTVPMTLTNSSLIDTSGVNCTLSGVLSGPGSLSKTGGGTLFLPVPNSYSGGTTNYAGQIVVPAGNALGTGPLTVAGGNVHCTGNLAVDRAVAVNGTGSTLTSDGLMEIGLGGTGSLSVTGGAAVTSPGSVAFGVLAGGTLGTAEVSGNGSALNCGTTMYIGYLSSGGVNVGSGASVTTGSMLLAAGPASQGFFNLTTGGTLNIGGAGGIAKGDGAATFNLDGGTLRVTGSSLSTNLPMTLTNTTVIDTNGINCTLSGVLSGPGNLVKATDNNYGALSITAANNLTGGTTVGVGILTLGTPTSLGTGPLALAHGSRVDLLFSGTATVQSLTIGGVPQVSGLWGSLESPAPNKSVIMTGPGVINVLTSNLPPAFNPAATAGLSYAVGSGSINLATATGATPAGGTFSGPGVSGGVFDPAVAGYGLHTITYNTGGSSTFTIAVTGGLTLVETGGAQAPDNFSLGGIAFAKDVFPHPNHTIPHLIDATYGNANSWFGISANSYAGVHISSGLAAVSRIAFGRDNTGAFTDRCQDFYTVQYSTDFNPNLPSSGSWITIGTLDYRPGGTAGITQPCRRHLFSFPAVHANALRIVCAASGTAIDEIEIYSGLGLFATGGITLLQEGGSFAHYNLAPAATAFAKDVLPHPSHTIEHLHDGIYGNDHSWLGLSAESFVGMSFGSPTTLDRIAFGRDNTGQLTDRNLGRYTLQYTTAPTPDASTPDSSWITIGLLDYQNTTSFRYSSPWLRHLFSFPSVTATGIRLLTPGNAAIDELELYQAAPHLKVQHLVGGTIGSEIAPDSSVDFGGTYTANPITKVFLLTNDGTGTLTLNSPVISGTNQANFNATDPGSFPIEPGQAAYMSVTYTAGAPGLSFASLRLPTNDVNAPDFIFGLTGTSLAPTFNPAATTGLIIDLSSGPIDLATATGATPAGGTFSGPGVIGGDFDSAAAGFGISTISYSYGGASASFTVRVTGGLNLLAEGGDFLPGNIAPAGTAFAYDSFLNDGPHTIPHLNDGIYGNANSWIGISDGTFAGISLGATVIPVNRIAFGRDNTPGGFADRATDYYTIQYTTVPNPDANTVAWTTIGAVDYRSPSITNPALRHVFGFSAVNATGLRIITTTAGTCIDEIEIYSPYTPRELWRQQYFGSPANTGDAADDFDFDHDGLTNLVEYAFGQNPVQPDSPEPGDLPSVSVSGNLVQLQLTRRPDLNDITLTAQASGDLNTWTDLAISTAGQPFAAVAIGTLITETGSGNTRAVTVTDTAPGSRLFLRVLAAPAP